MMNGENMPKKHIAILHANTTTIVLEGTVGKDYRFSIPIQLRQNISPETLVRITIEKIVVPNLSEKGEKHE